MKNPDILSGVITIGLLVALMLSLLIVLVVKSIPLLIFFGLVWVIILGCIDAKNPS